MLGGKTFTRINNYVQKLLYIVSVCPRGRTRCMLTQTTQQHAGVWHVKLVPVLRNDDFQMSITEKSMQNISDIQRHNCSWHNYLHDDE